MLPWEIAFRNGFAPLFSDEELRILHRDIKDHPERLCYGASVMPSLVDPTKCGRCCPVAYVAWQGREDVSVETAFEGYRQYYAGAEQRVGLKLLAEFFAFIDREISPLTFAGRLVLLCGLIERILTERGVTPYA